MALQQPYVQKVAALAAVVVSLLVGSAATFAVMQHVWRAPSTATLKAVGINVYSDAACTVPVVEIYWGIVQPGEERTFTAYVVNESNVPVNLTMYTEGWDPAEAAQFIAFSYDIQEGELGVGEALQVVFTLTVDPEISGITSFNFDIVIVGSG